MKRPKHKTLEDKTRVMIFRPLRDESGKYIPYCDFGYHPGLIRTPEICEKRHCAHYYKLYIK